MTRSTAGGWTTGCSAARGPSRSPWARRPTRGSGAGGGGVREGDGEVMLARDECVEGGRGAERRMGGGNRHSLDGQAENAPIEGGGKDDRGFGGAGAKRITGGAEADTLFGGGGRD